ncbi:class I SAM-dependent methyltransferase [Fervidicoccus fontis]|uniref:Cyclopropane fatty acid synthase-like protein n=1 Tax=Fervidicoccus fontis (strain DSM 19380 / JCM 18336 / VKM B-2539 / Kam940) TaxID=1163730 RepID=H9ZZZ5_FERFK|nr:class I SAM-dependent methyltransferase [Fervidicoccus fontis]AFH42302.1 Cyclopropane fatty acid synthase-like protein [Fervidicoccus fontis Kam940]
MREDIPIWPKEEKVDAPWIPSSIKPIIFSFEIAKLNKDSKICDIGCGDGRVAIIASKYFGCSSTCIEKREDLCALALSNAIYNSVNDKFSVICEDARKIDYSEFDFIYIYMFPSFLREISLKLDKELKEGTKIVTLDFSIEGWIPILMKRIEDEKGIIRSIFLYFIGISNPSAWRIRRFYGYPRI